MKWKMTGNLWAVRQKPAQNFLDCLMEVEKLAERAGIGDEEHIVMALLHGASPGVRSQLMAAKVSKRVSDMREFAKNVDLEADDTSDLTTAIRSLESKFDSLSAPTLQAYSTSSYERSRSANDGQQSYGNKKYRSNNGNRLWSNGRQYNNDGASTPQWPKYEPTYARTRGQGALRYNYVRGNRRGYGGRNYMRDDGPSFEVNVHGADRHHQ
jgi:hypothetical protein